MQPSPKISLGVLLFALGCNGSPQPQVDPPPRSRPVRVDRAVLGAFRGYLYAGYDLLLAQERPAGARVNQLRERQALAKEDLRRALRAKGATKAQVAGSDDLVRLVREGIQRGIRYALVTTPGDDTVSIVRVRGHNEPRTITLFGERFTYKRTIHDEVIVLDYAAYRALQLKRPLARQTATYRAEGKTGVVRIDRAAARMVGEQLFLPRVEALRASAVRATDVRAFLSKKDQLAALLTLTKDALRWRSLEPLWSRIGAQAKEEQLTRFVDDYTSRAELRAATELREAALALKGKPIAELTVPERVKLFERGSLSAMLHGDPLGQLADVLALAVVSLRGPRHEPHFQAARRLVLDIVAKLRAGKPSNDADARALARLAQASRNELQQIAKALYPTR